MRFSEGELGGKFVVEGRAGNGGGSAKPHANSADGGRVGAFRVDVAVRRGHGWVAGSAGAAGVAQAKARGAIIGLLSLRSSGDVDELKIAGCEGED